MCIIVLRIINNLIFIFFFPLDNSNRQCIAARVSPHVWATWASELLYCLNDNYVIHKILWIDVPFLLFRFLPSIYSGNFALQFFRYWTSKCNIVYVVHPSHVCFILTHTCTLLLLMLVVAAFKYLPNEFASVLKFETFYILLMLTLSFSIAVYFMLTLMFIQSCIWFYIIHRYFRRPSEIRCGRIAVKFDSDILSI